MPTCCVTNCTSSTNNKWLKCFIFPKNAALREQWLYACKKNEMDIKVDSARVCSLHFDKDCFVLEKTKPRSNLPAKEILRLKKGSVSTKMLILEKKRKRVISQSEENSKKIRTKSFLPNFNELLQFARDKQCFSSEKSGKNLETVNAGSIEEEETIEEQNKSRNVEQETMSSSITRFVPEIQFDAKNVDTELCTRTAQRDLFYLMHDKHMSDDEKQRYLYIN